MLEREAGYEKQQRAGLEYFIEVTLLGVDYFLVENGVGRQSRQLRHTSPVPEVAGVGPDELLLLQQHGQALHRAGLQHPEGRRGTTHPGDGDT